MYIGLCYRAYFLIFDYSLKYMLEFNPYPQIVPWDLLDKFDKT
jgi:hypothetical protein